MPELHVLDSAEETSQAIAGFVRALAKQRCDTQGSFSIALSGGSSPRRLYQLLASPPYAGQVAWDRWHLFWSDERCVPPEHDDSNYRMAKEALLDHVLIPEANVHRIRGEEVPHQTALDYEAVVKAVLRSPEPSLDLVLLGISDDGHTASLFPNTLALAEQSRLVLHNWVPELGVHRITFTLPQINAAKVVAFLDTEASKAEVLRRVLEHAPGEDMPPAGLVRPSSGIIHWFLSKEAAARLKSPPV